MPVHPHDLADAGGNDFQPAAVQVETIDLGMPLGRHADVARRANLEIELLVGPDGQIFPTVRLVLRQVAEDDGRLRGDRELVVVVLYSWSLGDAPHGVRAPLQAAASQ